MSCRFWQRICRLQDVDRPVLPYTSARTLEAVSFDAILAALADGLLRRRVFSNDDNQGSGQEPPEHPIHMKIVSLNCGLPREVDWHGAKVTTSFYKKPVQGRVVLRTLNLDGDRQSDLAVHGGKNKAVYCYPIEYYGYWSAQLPGRPLPYGSFGENFTVEGFTQEGLAEDSVYVGDRFSVGSAEVVVTQPRLPCYKLGIRFESDDMVQRFLNSRRTGFYLAVIREGDVGAGDELTSLSHDPDSVSISDITRLYVAKNFEPEDAVRVRRAIQVKALPASWKAYFEQKLNQLDM